MSKLVPRKLDPGPLSKVGINIFPSTMCEQNASPHYGYSQKQNKVVY